MPNRKRLALDILREVRHGEFLDDLTDALHEATTATTVHNKSSTVTITFKIKPEKGMAFLMDKITSNPALPENVTLFHVTTENNLSARSEYQKDIMDGLRVADEDGVPLDIDPQEPAQEAQ